MGAQPLKPTELWVIKRDLWGREVRRWAARWLWSTPRGWVVEAFFQGPAVTVAGLTFAPGDRMVEFYYTHRWYSLFAVYAGPKGKIKGWYADIGTPARWEQGALVYRDWALDVVLPRGGSLQVVDWAAFEALPLGAEQRRRALEALTEIRRRLGRWAKRPSEAVLQ